MRLIVLGTLAALAGCGGGAKDVPTQSATPAAPAPAAVVAAGPKVGDRVVYPTIGAAYIDAGSVRESRRQLAEASRLRKAKQSDDMGEAGKALRRRAVGTLWAGDLVEILEIGEDFAVVDVVRTHDGEPGKVHGYVPRWW